MATKKLTISTQNQGGEGYSIPCSPAKDNRHPSTICMHAKLGKLDSYTITEKLEILSLSDRPLAKLLYGFSRKSSPLIFRDWVFIVREYYHLTTIIEAYEMTEEISEHYFLARRFSSYDTFRKAVAAEYKKKKAATNL